MFKGLLIDEKVSKDPETPVSHTHVLWRWVRGAETSIALVFL